MPRQRVNFKQVKSAIRYRIFDGQVQVDLSFLLKKIGLEEKLDYEFDNRLFLLSYVDNKNKKIDSVLHKFKCGTSFVKMLLGNPEKEKPIDAVGINGETRRNRKMVSGNVRPERWSNEAFLDFFDDEHAKAYKIRSLEANVVNNKKSPSAKIKDLINKFETIGFTKTDVRDYIKWVFRNKSGKVAIGIGFLSSDVCIQEWMNQKVKEKNGKRKNVTKSKWA